MLHPTASHLRRRAYFRVGIKKVGLHGDPSGCPGPSADDVVRVDRSVENRINLALDAGRTVGQGNRGKGQVMLARELPVHLPGERRVRVEFQVFLKIDQSALTFALDVSRRI